MFITAKLDDSAPLSMMESERYRVLQNEETCQFPRLSEAAHFHYEEAKLQSLFLTAKLIPVVIPIQHQPSFLFEIGVFSGHAAWTVRKGLPDIFTLDHQLHVCLLDRSFSNLPALNNALRNVPSSHSNEMESAVESYFKLLAQLINNDNSSINCSLVLSWFELDNKGNHLNVQELRHLNIPAIAAAQVVRRHLAESDNELNLIEGDLISIVDMPSPSENAWWRGKKGFKVGYFPSQCVIIIDTRRAAESAADTVFHGNNAENTGNENRSPPSSSSPLSAESSSSSGSPSNKPVLKHHGKVASCLQVLFRERPSRDTLRQSGIVFDRVFGCDLGQYLVNHNLKDDVPIVVRWCVEMIERCGIVDGIYRHSGSNANINALRKIFDEGRLPNEADPTRDCHAVSCLLKTYFRELPNPLLTHNLYFDFIEVADCKDEQEGLAKMRRLLNRLPPPHHRTLKFIMAHLSRIAFRAGSTGMTPKNLSIVWAPNLLRPFLMAPKDCLLYITRQARAIELMIANYAQLFESPQKQGDYVPVGSLLPCSTAPAQPWLLNIDVAQKLYMQNSSLMMSSSIPVTNKELTSQQQTLKTSQSHENLKVIDGGCGGGGTSTASKCRAGLKKFANMVRGGGQSGSSSSKKATTRPVIVHCNPKMNQNQVSGTPISPICLSSNEAAPAPRKNGNNNNNNGAWRTISRSKSISSPDDPTAFIDEDSPPRQEDRFDHGARRWPLASDNSMVWTGNNGNNHPSPISSSFTALNQLFMNSTPITQPKLGSRSTSKVVLVRGAATTTTPGTEATVASSFSPRPPFTRHRSADELSTGLASGCTSVTTLSPLPPRKMTDPSEMTMDQVIRLISTNSGDPPGVVKQSPSIKTSIEHATPVVPVDLIGPPSPTQQVVKPSSASRQLLLVPLKQQQNVVEATPASVKDARLIFENSDF